MGVPIERDYHQLAAEGMSRHEAISAVFERSIAEGRLSTGTRLPTVRSLSSELGVSGTTVAAAYQLLSQRGWTRGQVGRERSLSAHRHLPLTNVSFTTVKWWSRPIRRDTSTLAATDHAHVPARLRSAYPDALDCTSGKPDPTLFLADIFLRSWQQAIAQTDVLDLQYASPEPVPSLAQALTLRLKRDSITTAGAGMVIGSSAQQLMVLSLSVLSKLSKSAPRIVAVEEPGYQTVFDAFEHMGYRLVGMEVDDEGVTPDALSAALAVNAQAVLFTPRAQNPYGASWSTSRRMELANVLVRIHR